MRSAESSFGRSLALLKDQGLQAIEQRSVDSFTRILQRHIGFLGDYLKARSRFRVVMQQRKPTMIGLLGYESTIVYKICSSIEELLKRAFQLQNVDLIARAAAALVEALTLAIDSEALWVFRRILGLVQASYFLSFSIEDPAKRAAVIDRLSNSVEGFSNYYLVSIKLRESPKKVTSLSDYGKALVLTYNTLIKQAIDRSDNKAFSSFVEAAVGVASPGYRDIGGDLQMAEVRLRLADSSGPDRKELEERVVRLRDEVEFFQVISRAKRDIFYCLGCWAVKRFDDNQLRTNQIQEIMGIILPQLGGFESLTELYIRHLSDSTDPFGWSLWEAQEAGKVRGGAYAQVSEDWIHEFYVLGAVRAMSGPANEDQLGAAIESTSMSSASLESAAAKIREVSASISSGSHKWSALLPEMEEHPTESEAPRNHAIGKFELLNELWQRMVSRRHAAEEINLLESDLAKDVLETFNSDFRKAWNEASVFRQLAKAYGFYEDHVTDQAVPDSVKRLRFDRLEQKQWFISGNSFAARSIGENLGNGFGGYETAQVFDAISTAIEPLRVETPQAAIEMLDGFIEAINQKEINSFALVTLLGYEFEMALYQTGQFERVRNVEGIEISARLFRGKYRNIPVIPISIPGRTKNPCLVCAHMRGLGTWQQYWAAMLGQEIEISVSRINEEKARTLLQENPGLRPDRPGQEETEAASILRLQKNVRIQISERFLFTVNKDRMAIRIDLTDA